MTSKLSVLISHFPFLMQIERIVDAGLIKQMVCHHIRVQRDLLVLILNRLSLIHSATLVYQSDLRFLYIFC